MQDAEIIVEDTLSEKSGLYFNVWVSIARLMRSKMPALQPCHHYFPEPGRNFICRPQSLKIMCNFTLVN